MAGKFPVDKVMQVLGAGREAQKGQGEPFSVAVWVDPESPRALLEALRDALLPEQATGLVEVRSLRAGFVEREGPTDAAVVVPGACREEAVEAVRAFTHRGTPVALVVESAVEAPDASLDEEHAALVEVVAASEPAHAMERLAKWLVGATDKGIACAANFPFCREAEVRSLVTSCAISNAAVGSLSLVKGADMPIMTANQAKLALDVAAAYGNGLDAMRAVEVAGVVGAGLAYRWVARVLSAALPGMGWLTKGAMGYVGTVATGRALQLRFDAAEGKGRERMADLEATMARARARGEGLVSGLPGKVADVGGAGAHASTADDFTADAGYIVIPAPSVREA